MYLICNVEMELNLVNFCTVSYHTNSLLWLCSSLTFLFKNLILSLIILACLFNKIAVFFYYEGSLLLYIFSVVCMLRTHSTTLLSHSWLSFHKDRNLFFIYNVCVCPSRTQSNLLWKRTENKVCLARPRPTRRIKVETT